jgi:hypothetical protein
MFWLSQLLGWSYYLCRLVGRGATWRRPIAIRRILVARGGMYLGDLLAFTPMLRKLRQRCSAIRRICRSMCPIST